MLDFQAIMDMIYRIAYLIVAIPIRFINSLPKWVKITVFAIFLLLALLLAFSVLIQIRRNKEEFFGGEV